MKAYIRFLSIIFALLINSKGGTGNVFFSFSAAVSFFAE